jgi:hypothetical protein
MRTDEAKAVKSSQIVSNAPSKSELNNYYEHMLSIIWNILKHMIDC